MNARLLMAGAAVPAIVAIGLGIRLLSPDGDVRPRGRSIDRGTFNVDAPGDAAFNPVRTAAPAHSAPIGPLNLGNLIPAFVPNQGGAGNGDPGAPPATGNPPVGPKSVNPLGQGGGGNPLGAGKAPARKPVNPLGAD